MEISGLHLILTSIVMVATVIINAVSVATVIRSSINDTKDSINQRLSDFRTDVDRRFDAVNRELADFQLCLVAGLSPLYASSPSGYAVAYTTQSFD